MIELMVLVIYLIIGIGYAKTHAALVKVCNPAWWILCALMWPLYLVIASFWNFDNED